VSGLNDVLERMATIQANIVATMPNGKTEKVTGAYPYIQGDIPSTMVPFFANEVSDWTSDAYAVGGSLGQHIQTPIKSHLCLMGSEQGVSLAVNLQTIIAWRDAVYAAFAAAVQLNKGLGQIPNVTAAYISSGGLESVQLGSNTYAGIRFDFPLTEHFTVPVGS